jgi:dienelactone hydrolase
MAEMANAADTKTMLTPRARSLLGGLLAVVTLVGCGHLLISYEGAKIRPGHEIPIVTGEQQSGQYTTDDVTVDYTYRQTGDQLRISGRVLFADYLRLNYGLRYFHLGLVLADEGNTILRNYPLTSTGYGRKYRERLNGQWGVVDVNDCANAARYLASQGLVDGARLAISGGSAGGYTTLCALAFTDVFKAGASHFGIGDLETFVYDTHKFESRYLDRLVGPYPERKDLYRQRSAIHYVDQINCPVILFQGLEDKIVPPSQSETMFAAVRAKGLPAAYVPFEGEQHGFRKAENIQRALEGELYFYARIFGFELADPVEPVKIENLEMSS